MDASLTALEASIQRLLSDNAAYKSQVAALQPDILALQSEITVLQPQAAFAADAAKCCAVVNHNTLVQFSSQMLPTFIARSALFGNQPALDFRNSRWLTLQKSTLTHGEIWLDFYLSSLTTPSYLIGYSANGGSYLGISATAITLSLAGSRSISALFTPQINTRYRLRIVFDNTTASNNQIWINDTLLTVSWNLTPTQTFSFDQIGKRATLFSSAVIYNLLVFNDFLSVSFAQVIINGQLSLPQYDGSQSWYVDPLAGQDGLGSQNDPFRSLLTALSDLRVRDNQTFFLKSGTHALGQGIFPSAKNLTAKPFADQDATIDLSGTTADNPLALPDGFRFRPNGKGHLRFTSFPTTRVSPQRGTYPPNSGWIRVAGIAPDDGVFVGCYLDNLITVTWQQSAGGMLYDQNLIANFGFDATSTYDGEAGYIQNPVGATDKHIQRVAISPGYGLVFQIYSVAASNAGLILSDVLVLASMTQDGSIWASSPQPWSKLEMDRCFVLGGSRLLWGYTRVQNGACILHDNYFFTHQPIALGSFTSQDIVNQITVLDQTPYPVQNVIHIVPLDTGRFAAFIAIANWQQLSSVQVALPSNLVAGNYRLRSIDNVWNETPSAPNNITDFAYDGNSLVSVHFDGRSVATPHGGIPLKVPDPRLGIWLLERV